MKQSKDESTLLLVQNDQNLSLYALQTNLLKVWTQKKVDKYYQKAMLAYMDNLPQQQAKQQIIREHQKMLQNRSQFSKIKEYMKNRQEILQILQGLLQNQNYLDQACQNIDKLRKINLKLCECILQIKQALQTRGVSSIAINEGYNQLFKNLQQDNKPILSSYLQKYINFGQGYDPFFLVPYQKLQKKTNLDSIPKAVQKLFKMNISYVYRLIKIKLQLVRSLSLTFNENDQQLNQTNNEQKSKIKIKKIKTEHHSEYQPDQIKLPKYHQGYYLPPTNTQLTQHDLQSDKYHRNYSEDGREPKYEKLHIKLPIIENRRYSKDKTQGENFKGSRATIKKKPIQQYSHFMSKHPNYRQNFQRSQDDEIDQYRRRLISKKLSSRLPRPQYLQNSQLYPQHFQKIPLTLIKSQNNNNFQSLSAHPLYDPIKYNQLSFRQNNFHNIQPYLQKSKFRSTNPLNLKNKTSYHQQHQSQQQSRFIGHIKNQDISSIDSGDGQRNASKQYLPNLYHGRRKSSKSIPHKKLSSRRYHDEKFSHRNDQPVNRNYSQIDGKQIYDNSQPNKQHNDTTNSLPNYPHHHQLNHSQNHPNAYQTPIHNQNQYHPSQYVISNANSQLYGVVNNSPSGGASSSPYGANNLPNGGDNSQRNRVPSHHNSRVLPLTNYQRSKDQPRYDKNNNYNSSHNSPSDNYQLSKDNPSYDRNINYHSSGKPAGNDYNDNLPYDKNISYNSPIKLPNADYQPPNNSPSYDKSNAYNSSLHLPNTDYQHPPDNVPYDKNSSYHKSILPSSNYQRTNDNQPYDKNINYNNSRNLPTTNSQNPNARQPQDSYNTYNKSMPPSANYQLPNGNQPYNNTTNHNSNMPQSGIYQLPNDNQPFDNNVNNSSYNLNNNNSNNASPMSRSYANDNINKNNGNNYRNGNNNNGGGYPNDSNNSHINNNNNNNGNNSNMNTTGSNNRSIPYDRNNNSINNSLNNGTNPTYNPNRSNYVSYPNNGNPQRQNPNKNYQNGNQNGNPFNNQNNNMNNNDLSRSNMDRNNGYGNNTNNNNNGKSNIIPIQPNITLSNSQPTSKKNSIQGNSNPNYNNNNSAYNNNPMNNNPMNNNPMNNNPMNNNSNYLNNPQNSSNFTNDQYQQGQQYQPQQIQNGQSYQNPQDYGQQWKQQPQQQRQQPQQQRQQSRSQSLQPPQSQQQQQQRQFQQNQQPQNQQQPRSQQQQQRQQPRGSQMQSGLQQPRNQQQRQRQPPMGDQGQQQFQPQKKYSSNFEAPQRSLSTNREQQKKNSLPYSQSQQPSPMRNNNNNNNNNNNDNNNYNNNNNNNNKRNNNNNNNNNQYNQNQSKQNPQIQIHKIPDSQYSSPHQPNKQPNSRSKSNNQQHPQQVKNKSQPSNNNNNQQNYSNNQQQHPQNLHYPNQQNNKDNPNTKRQIQMKPGQIPINDLFKFIQQSKILPQSRKQFQIGTWRQIIKNNHCYLTRFIVNSQLAAFGITTVRTDGDYQILYWGALSPDKVTSFLFKKYVQYLQKFTSLNQIYIYSNSYVDMGFQQSQSNAYVRQRSAIQKKQLSFTPFLQFQCSNVCFRQDNDQQHQIFYSQQIQQFNAQASLTNPQIAFAECKDLSKLPQQTHMHQGLHSMVQVNQTLQKYSADTYAISEQIKTGVCKLLLIKDQYEINTNQFYVRDGFFMTKGSQIYNNSNSSSLVYKLTMERQGILMYFGKRFQSVQDFLKLCNIKSPGPSKYFAFKMFSKQLYGRLKNQQYLKKGCYGNWDITFVWQDQLKGVILKTLPDDRYKFGPDNFFVAIFKSNKLLFGFQVNSNDFLI